MIDNIKISILCLELAHLFYGKTNSVDFNGIVFNPVIFQSQVVKWVANYKNLRLTFIKDLLFIENSIHKFYHGNNYSDFTYLNLNQAFIDLSVALNLDLLVAEVKKIEYGCNIEVNNTTQIIENVITYHNHFFLPMSSKSKIYGKKLQATDYAIKLYDKQLEVKLHNKLSLEIPLLRYEKEIINMRFLLKKGIAIRSVADLLNVDNLNLLANDLISTFVEIQKKHFLDLGELKIEELKKYCLLENSDARKVALKKYRVSLNRYLKEFENKVDTDFYKNIENKISEKLFKLLH